MATVAFGNTEILTWECPECEAENEIFAFEGEDLPDELECAICNHQSGRIIWDKV